MRSIQEFRELALARRAASLESLCLDRELLVYEADRRLYADQAGISSSDDLEALWRGALATWKASNHLYQQIKMGY